MDSGADNSVVPKDVAELLELDLNKPKEEARGIGGKVPSVQTSMNIELKRSHEAYSFRIPVKVILKDEIDEMPILLGRAGFFDKFIVTFNQKEERIILKRNL